MSEPKKYHEMTREERIAESDKAAIRELEAELRKKIKQEHQIIIKEKTLQNIIEEWLRKHQYQQPPPQPQQQPPQQREPKEQQRP